jgi:segregation and condensation protein A
MSYVLETPTYQGPVEKLLELVEAKQVDITDVGLSRVTGDFLEYFRGLEEQEGVGVELKGVLADFLVVASRLLLIKSKVLIPSLELSDEEEEDIRDLRERLAVYRELRGARRHIGALWSEVPMMVVREYMGAREPVFYPPKRVGARELLEALVRVAGVLERELLPVEKIERQVINLKEKIAQILARVTHGGASLQALRGTGSREELVVLFMAVLHLVRDMRVSVEQDEGFGDIQIAGKRENE